VVTKWTYSEIATILKPGTEVHDDIAFVQAMLDRIEATWTIDRDRIYATGFSNGGAFTTTRVMMEMADVFAAFAVAGSGVLPPTYQVTPSDETAERSLYILLGTNDDKVFGNPAAVASGITDDFPSTAEEFLAHPYIQAIFGRWFEVLGLETTYTEELGRPARDTLTFDNSLADAPNEFRIRVVRNMFHIYPGPSDKFIGFQACDLFWDFFQQHPLGE
jgi:poly(3-hydroxybutyrate) depolymerase